jgi:hypothetical protein
MNSTPPVTSAIRSGFACSRRRAAVAALLTIGLVAAANGTAQADPWGAQSDLSAIAGHGLGKVILSPNHKYPGEFDARVKVNLHDAAPNTTFTVTRAIDFTADGNCTNTQFDPVITLTTSTGGAGAVEFERGPSVLPTDAFDIQVQVDGADGTVLQSDCMTLRVK